MGILEIVSPCYLPLFVCLKAKIFVHVFWILCLPCFVKGCKTSSSCTTTNTCGQHPAGCISFSTGRVHRDLEGAGGQMCFRSRILVIRELLLAFKIHTKTWAFGKNDLLKRGNFQGKTRPVPQPALSRYLSNVPQDRITASGREAGKWKHPFLNQNPLVCFYFQCSSICFVLFYYFFFLKKNKQKK